MMGFIPDNMFIKNSDPRVFYPTLTVQMIKTP